ncbi:MAG: CpaB [Bacilli bacterium]|nr:CpaB [Bacilli bacterium]
MKPRSMALIFIVFVCFIVGGFFLYFGVNKQLHEDLVYVVKPGMDIETNVQITKSMLVQLKKHTVDLPPTTILDDSMVGKYAKYTLFGGRAILQREIDQEATVDTGLGFNLKPGERMVSVTADNNDSIGGMLNKGLFVDIQWVKSLNGNAEKKAIVPLFEHLEILDIRSKYGASIFDKAANQKSDSKIKIVADAGKDLKDLYPLEIVLRASPEEMETINLAKKSGNLTLGLNPEKQDSNVKLPSLTSDDLLKQKGVKVIDDIKIDNTSNR